MARLPDKTALGALPNIDPGRTGPAQIPLGALSAIGEGGRAIGAGIASIGEGFEQAGKNFEAEDKKQEAENDQLELARARSHFLTGSINLADEVSKDPDYTTAGKRFDDGIGTLGQEAAGMINNPRRRELFSLSIQDDIARGRVNIAKKADEQEKTAVLADAEQRINYNLEVIGRTADPVDRMKIIQSTHDMIEGLQRRGILDPREALKTRQTWLERLGTSWLEGMTPEQREEALRPYVPLPGDESRAAARNPRAAAVEAPAAAEPAKPAEQPKPVRDYGDTKFPITVPGGEWGRGVIQNSPMFKQLPKELQDKINGGKGPLTFSKEDLEGVPLPVLQAAAKTAKEYGVNFPVPTEKAPPKAAAPAGDGQTAISSAIVSKASVRTPVASPEARQAVIDTANRLRIDPRDLAAAMSYETGGKFDPDIMGGKGGRYMGLIQFGPNEQKKYGVTPGMSIEQQMTAVEGYLRDRGLKPGSSLSDIYRTINGGNPNASLNASDGNGTIAQHIKKIEAGDHYANADKFLGTTGQPGQVQVAQAGGAPVGMPEPVRTGTPADFISQKTRIQLYEKAQQDVLQRRTAASVNRGDEYDRNIIDASASRGPLVQREAIEQDPLLTPAKRNELLKRWDGAAGDVVKFQQAITKFKDPNGGSFNPFDKEEKGAVDKIYEALGGNNNDPNIRQAALSAVVERTGMVPDRVAVGLRGGLVSQNPIEVQNSLQTVSRLYFRNSNAFEGVTGKSEFEDAALWFQHQVNDRGMSTDAAAQKFMREQTSEYKAEVKARLKGEDVDELIKKKASINDLENAFDDAWFARDPKVAFSHGDRLRMYSTYLGVLKERYLEGNGDFDLAKKQAYAELKKVWGISTVNGSKVVVPYPPEKSPGFSDIPNAADLIAKDAVDTIKAETGKAVERSQLRIGRMPDGSTEAAFKSGRPTPYMISYTDQNGVLQILNPGRGRAFVPDAAAARNLLQEERRQALEGARADEQRMQSNPLSPQSIRSAIGNLVSPATAEPTAEPVTPEREVAIQTREAEKDAARQKLIDEGVIVPGGGPVLSGAPRRTKMKPGGVVLPGKRSD